jgi:hypothetical protein
MLAAVISGCGLLLGPVSAAAHHAFASVFDANKPVKMRGVVTKMEWINPHSWLHVEVKTSDGKVENWMVEAGTPMQLFRQGVTKDALPVGAEVIVDGYQAKDGSKRLNGRDVTFPDGRKVFLGSTGTGAPYDEKAAPAAR